MIHPADSPLRYTFWLAKNPYSRTANQISVTRQGLEAIDLNKSGLYPEIETPAAA